MNLFLGIYFPLEHENLRVIIKPSFFQPLQEAVRQKGRQRGERKKATLLFLWDGFYRKIPRTLQKPPGADK